MASMWPDEGLDFLLTIVPGAETPPNPLWMGFYVSQSPTTTPGASAVLASSLGVTEASGVTYARQPIYGIAWNAPVDGGTGRQRTTASPVAFPTVGPGGWGTLNGFFLASAQSGGAALYYANFDDATAIVSDINDIIAVTPTLRYAR